MKTLKRCYNEIALCACRWSYYGPPSICISDTWNCDTKALHFIEDYFELGGKIVAFKDTAFSNNQEALKKRAAHTISTFLLGIKIAESFNIETQVRDKQNMGFLYYWFLACLYHDIGYVYEDTPNCEYFHMVSGEGIEALQEICNIKYLHNRSFKTYKKEIVDLYLKYRASGSSGKPTLDHGIVGGLMLYDKLRKQFEDAWKIRSDCSNSRNSFFVNVNQRQLCFSNNHFSDYAKAADAIITHNIWKDTLEDCISLCECCRQSFTYEKININNPICFVLSIADTLEPLKRGAVCALDGVQIGSLHNQLGFQLKMNPCIYELLYKKINSLEDWVSVNVCIDMDTDVTIRITAK